MVRPPVRSIIHELKLVDYLSVQADKSCFIYHVSSGGWGNGLPIMTSQSTLRHYQDRVSLRYTTIKILKFGTPQTIAIIVLKIEKFIVTLH